MAKSEHFANSKILVPFDFSDFSMQAVQTACAIANRNEQVTVLHVINPAQLYGFDDNGGYELGGDLSIAASDIEGAKEINESNQQHAVRAMEGLLADPQFSGIDFATLVDVPQHGIVQFASQNGCDLIVISSHGRTGVKRVMIGSVAEQVVRASHCPVLMLRSPSE